MNRSWFVVLVVLVAVLLPRQAQPTDIVIVSYRPLMAKVLSMTKYLDSQASVTVIPVDSLADLADAVVQGVYGGTPLSGAIIPPILIREVHDSRPLAVAPAPLEPILDPAVYAYNIGGTKRGFPLMVTMLAVLVRADVSPQATNVFSTLDNLLHYVETINGTDVNGDGISDFGMCVYPEAGLWPCRYSPTPGTVPCGAVSMVMAIMAAMMQSKGSAQGAFMDPSTMNPLFNTLGARSAVNMFNSFSKYAYFGTEAEVNDAVRSGACPVTVGPLDMMTMANNSAYRDVYQIQAFPGSEVVVERNTGQLLACSSEGAVAVSLCPHAVFGVNVAPSVCLGGWGGIVYEDQSTAVKSVAWDLFKALEMHGTDVLHQSVTKISWWRGLGYPSELAASAAVLIEQVVSSPNRLHPLSLHRGLAYQDAIATRVDEVVRGSRSSTSALLDLQTAWAALNNEIGHTRQSLAYSEILTPDQFVVLSESPSSSLHTTTIFALIVSLAILTLAICGILLYFFVHRLRRKDPNDVRPITDDGDEQGTMMYNFAVADVDAIKYSDLQIVKPIGIGSFGEVFLARWRDSDVAVKRMHSKAFTPEQFGKFMAETRLLMKLRNANVIQYIGTVVDPPCLITEYMERGSLFSVLHNPLISIDQPLKMQWAIGIAEGMQFLHASDVLHRDFKSLNILISRNWTPKISDFGLSTLKESVALNDDVRTQDGTDSEALDYGDGGIGDGDAIVSTAVLMGSVYWTAPEVLAGEPYTKAADVYSYGIVLWEIMSRAKLYPSYHNQYAVAMQVIRNTLRPPIDQMPERPTSVRSLAQRCWHVEALQRPTFERILASLQSHGSVPIGSAAPRVDIAEVPMGAVFVANVKVKKVSEWGLSVSPQELSRALLQFQTLIKDAAHESAGFIWLRHMDQFCVAFQTGARIVSFCSAVHAGLLRVDWSDAIQSSSLRMSETGDDFKGLAVGITVHYGILRTHRDMKTDAIFYTHPGLDLINILQAFCYPGQTLLSFAACSARGLVSELVLDSSSAMVADLVELRTWPPELGEPRTYPLVEGKPAQLYMSVQLPGVPFRKFPKPPIASAPTVVASDLRAHSPTASDLHLMDSNEDASTSMSVDVGSSPNTLVVHENRAPDDQADVVLHESFSVQRHMLCCRPPESSLVVPSPWLAEPYEIELSEREGVGSYATTWRGSWRGRTVCVKVFLLQQLSPRELVGLVAQFLEYRRISVGLDHMATWLADRAHPNIAAASGVCLRPPVVGFITEYLDHALSLQEYLVDETLTLGLSDGLSVFRQVVMGVMALHSRGLFHGALNPHNVLVQEHNRVSLTDYGFFDIRVSLQTATAVGDVMYVAPEVLLGEPMTRRADIYALGMLLFGILTKAPPVITSSSMESALLVVEGKRPVAPPGLSREALSLVSICWHPSPHVRPTAQMVLQIIDTWTIGRVEIDSSSTGYPTSPTPTSSLPIPQVNILASDDLSV